jgi:hypothetical protein
MNLYEVIRWGNESDNIYTGGPNGPDTCFLVRAATHEAAGELVDQILARMPHEFVSSYAGCIYLLGTDVGADDRPRVCRGPYVEHCHNCGKWRQWHRDAPADPWYEFVAVKTKGHRRNTNESG